MRLMSASAMVHSYAQEWEAATDCAETCQLWAASGLEKASVGYIEEQVRSVYTRLSCLCFAYLGGFHFKTNSQIGPNLMKTFKTIWIYWKTAIATTTATSLKPPPAFVFTSMGCRVPRCRRRRQLPTISCRACCRACRTTAPTTPPVSDGDSHLCQLDIMNHEPVCDFLWIKKKKRLGKLEVEAYMYNIFLYIFVRYSL